MKRGIFILGLVFFDQISKYFARIYYQDPLEIFSFFSLRYVENTGIAFSIPLPVSIIFLLVILVMFFLGYQLFFCQNTPKIRMAYLLIFSGAFGNIMDRILFGGVADFLSFWNFPIFNLADAFVFCGISFYFYEEIFGKPKK